MTILPPHPEQLLQAYRASTAPSSCIEAWDAWMLARLEHRDRVSAGVAASNAARGQAIAQTLDDAVRYVYGALPLEREKAKAIRKRVLAAKVKGELPSSISSSLIPGNLSVVAVSKAISRVENTRPILAVHPKPTQGALSSVQLSV